MPENELKNETSIEESRVIPNTPNFSKSAYHKFLQEIESKLTRNVVLTEIELKTVMRVLSEEEFRYSENA